MKNQNPKTRMGRRRNEAQSGFVLIVTSLAIVMMLGFLGLAVDVGFMQFQKRRIQSAADSAAQGGAFEVLNHSNNTAIISAAKHDSALNGFSDGVNGVTVTVNYPPASGAYATQTNAVEAIVSQDTPTYFMSLFGFTSAPIAARAVARATSSSNCVYVLDTSSADALVAAGNGNAQIRCGVMVDSSNSKAAEASGNGCISAIAITIVGNYNSSSNGCGLSPTPVTGAPTVSDPLAYLTPPPVGACDHVNYNQSGGVVTLNPGVYCGGITISGTSSVLYLNPGTYVMNGGGFSVSSQANIIGNGVTIYNTGSASYAYQPISITGGSTTVLTAPTTGSLAGILFFQDRSITTTSKTSVNTIAGGSSTTYTGGLYFPTSALNYSGNSLTNGGYTLIVAKTLSFTGLSALNADYSTLPGGSPIKGGVAFGE
jgi:hypothetical protein